MHKLKISFFSYKEEIIISNIYKIIVNSLYHKKNLKFNEFSKY